MGIGIWQALIVLLIIVLLFGTKRLRNIGSDLGSAIKGFKKSVNDDSETKPQEKTNDQVEHQQQSAATRTDNKDQ